MLASTRALNILLVEDNVVNQKLARFILTQAGHQVEVASNGQVAVDIFTASPSRFDMILMDIQMPILDGISATLAIRTIEARTSTPATHTVPIIAMTAEAMKGDRDRCLAAGMNDYLSKPIKREKVNEIVKKWTPPRKIGTPGELHRKE